MRKQEIGASFKCRSKMLLATSPLNLLSSNVGFLETKQAEDNLTRRDSQWFLTQIYLTHLASQNISQISIANSPIFAANFFKIMANLFFIFCFLPLLRYVEIYKIYKGEIAKWKCIYGGTFLANLIALTLESQNDERLLLFIVECHDTDLAFGSTEALSSKPIVAGKWYNNLLRTEILRLFIF